MKRYLAFGIVTVVSLALDQVTKLWAETALQRCAVTARASQGPAPEIVRCHDRGVAVRLPRAARALRWESGAGFDWSLRCETGAACLAGDVLLGAPASGATASGQAPERLSPGASSTVTVDYADGSATLAFRYEKMPIVLIEEYLELNYESNPGAAFSFLAGNKALRGPVLTGVAILASLLILWLAYKLRPGQHLLATALALVLSGAVGNLIDRLRLSYVSDFVLFHIRESFYWPTFNVADSTIVVGVALLVIDSIRGWIRERRAKKASARR